MDLEIKKVIEAINKANSFLSNACVVHASELSQSLSSIKRTKEEENSNKDKIAEEENKRIQVAKSKAQLNIEENNDYIEKIAKLNMNLISVDKKYAKHEKSINLAGVSDELKESILKEMGYKDVKHTDIKIVENLFNFYKTNSYKYITKPVCSLLLESKKRANIYDQLASCVILAKEYAEKNNKKFIDQRDKEIEEIKEEIDEQVTNLKKRYETKTSNIQQNSQSDREFIVDECVKEISGIFNENFYESFKAMKEKVKKSFNLDNTDNTFQDEIFIGDLAFNFPNNVIDSQIGRAVVKSHEKLFEDDVLFLPTSLKVSNCQSVYITPSSISDKANAKSFVNQLIYSFLRQFPLNGLEFLILDPDQKGNSIFPFLNLPTLLPEMFSKKIWTSSEEISSKISELNQYVDSVIQQKLSNKFKNVFEYNLATPQNPMPIKVVCIFDFPKFFDTRSFENLVSVIKNASRCGIFVVCCFSPSELKNGGNEEIRGYIEEIKSYSINLTQTKDFTILDGTSLILSAPSLPKQSALDEYFIKYERACKKKLSEGIPFISVVKDNDFFAKSSAEGLLIPVGKGDGSATQFIEFGKRSSQHALITGATGSGKSTLLHTLIMSAIINYSPDEINLYLMDFKGGTEFKVYETIKVPHIKLLALDALQEFGESILMELVEEQKRRSQLFKDNGEHTSLKSFVSATGQKMPRILVVMDEFQILFNESANRKVARHCAELANKIVTEGRAFGIHLIMATQTLRSINENSALANSTIEQMRIRIGLKCGETDAKYIFGDANSQDALQKMKGAIGTAVYNPEFTEATNSGFRVAYCPEQEQKNLLSSIKEISKEKFPTNMKVFEGKRIPHFPDSLWKKYIDNNSPDIFLELGEPVKIDDPIEIVLGKKKNNNLLVVGSDHDFMNRIINIVAMEIAITKGAKLHYFDGNAFFDEPMDPFIEKLVDSGQDIHLVNTRKECILTIEQLHEEFKNRRKSISTNTEKHVVLINGLQHVDILCSMLKGDRINREDYIETEEKQEETKDDDFSFNFSSSRGGTDYMAMIKDLVETGYTYGLHFVIGCNDYQAVKDILNYGASLLNKLTNRIVFAISDRDCDSLIEGVQVSGMNNISAIFTDGIKRTMQFKPYALPNLDKMDKI